MKPLAFLDIESTGLDVAVHEPWEIGLVLDVEGRVERAVDWLVEPINLDLADPKAMELNGFRERESTIVWEDPYNVADDLRKLTDGAIPINCNIHFDLRFLEPWLPRWGQEPTWHYSPIDVKSMCYAAKPSMIGANTDALLESFEIDVEKAAPGRTRHTALGDALLARALFYRVTGLPHG